MPRPRRMRARGLDTSPSPLGVRRAVPLRSHRIHRDLAPVAAPPLESHHAAGQRKQGIVAANADVLSGPVARAPLAHKHAAGRDRLARERLDAEPLRVAVTSVSRTAAALLMR